MFLSSLGRVNVTIEKMNIVEDKVSDLNLGSRASLYLSRQDLGLAKNNRRNNSQ